jgi:hypothetical protein
MFFSNNGHNNRSDRTHQVHLQEKPNFIFDIILRMYSLYDFKKFVHTIMEFGVMVVVPIESLRATIQI